LCVPSETVRGEQRALAGAIANHMIVSLIEGRGIRGRPQLLAGTLVFRAGKSS